MSERNGRLDALLKREAALKEAIVREKLARQRRAAKEFERLKNIVGGALLANAAQHPDFELLLKSTLAKSALDDADTKFLRAKGYL